MQTPSVVLDEKRLLHNIERMQALATANHVNLRPHAKTHKTREVATMQLAAGACGITVSKPSEALQFLRGQVTGLKSLTLAYPVVQSNKVEEVLKAAQETGVEFLLTVDSSEGVDAAQKAAEACGCSLKLLIHVDVGYHRVGIEQDDPKLLQLAQRIQKTNSLEFRGLLSHAGHAYHCKSVAECSEVAEIERQTMANIKATLEANGIAVAVVSVGSTLTEFARKSFEGITEIRPGNYVFLDRTPVRMGLFSVQDVALTVLATVYNFIVDSGSKVLSSDRARSAGEFGSSCFGLAFYEKDFERVVNEPTQHKTLLDDGQELICFELTSLSEEHGWVKKVEGVPSPAIGERLVIVPNHACVVANLTNKFYVQGKEPKSWTLLSRGCTQ
ncbi:Alanine racemase [Phytophthora megakarya]|uniref:D-serine dehydratase n=1 Tax=Phytophthora megakarya TaxID=4795 RepID=A0A225WPD1_9STRA|nr:Alanine racemase [Phytophthora megakarya]